MFSPSNDVGQKHCQMVRHNTTAYHLGNGEINPPIYNVWGTSTFMPYKTRCCPPLYPWNLVWGWHRYQSLINFLFPSVAGPVSLPSSPPPSTPLYPSLSNNWSKLHWCHLSTEYVWFIDYALYGNQIDTLFNPRSLVVCSVVCEHVNALKLYSSASRHGAVKTEYRWDGLYKNPITGGPIWYSVPNCLPCTLS